MIDRRQFMTAIAAGIVTALLPTSPIPGTPTGLDKKWLGQSVTLAPGESVLLERTTAFNLFRWQLLASASADNYFHAIKPRIKPLFDEGKLLRSFENAFVAMNTADE